MASTIRLRHLAEVNPSTPTFDRLSDDSPVTFMPLEAVWADDRLDTSRARPKGDVSTGYVRFAAGDILCPKVTPTFQAARSALVARLPLPAGAASTEVHIVRARPDIADSRFIRYSLLSKPFLEEGVARFQGVAGLQRVPDEFLRDFSVAELAIAQQRRIADFLDDQVARFDKIVAARQAQVGLVAQQLRISIDTLFDGRPRPFRTLLAQNPCYGVLVPRFVDAGVPFIRVGDLLRLDDGHELVQINELQSREYQRTVVAAGDVLLSVVGSIDKSAIVSPKHAGANVARAVARLQPANGVPSALIASWFSTSAYLDQARLATGNDTAQPTLNMGDLSAFRIRLPDRDLGALASEIALVRELADRATGLLQKSVRLSEELKRSLITAAVTGEFDVSAADGSRVAVAREWPVRLTGDTLAP